MALQDYCDELRNYFIHDYDEDIYLDTYTISDGAITPFDFIETDQYFRIVGSMFNDGIYKNTTSLELVDEVFTGAVWAMYVPPNFLEIVAEADSYLTANPDSTITSESFGGYSYNKAFGNNANLFDYLPKSISQKLICYRKLRI